MHELEAELDNWLKRNAAAPRHAFTRTLLAAQLLAPQYDASARHAHARLGDRVLCIKGGGTEFNNSISTIQTVTTLGLVIDFAYCRQAPLRSDCTAQSLVSQATRRRCYSMPPSLVRELNSIVTLPFKLCNDPS